MLQLLLGLVSGGEETFRLFPVIKVLAMNPGCFEKTQYSLITTYTMIALEI